MSNAATPQVDSPLTYGLVWFGLLALLGLTLLAAHGLAGTLGTAVGLTIATVKAALVFWFFLHLRHQRGLTRVTAVFALLWLALLMMLTLADYLTRPGGF